MGRKLKEVKVNDLVSVPDRIIFPGRRDPYEWENGIVTEVGRNKKGQKVAQVRIWNHFTRKVYEKWFLAAMLERPSYHHQRDEEVEFLEWVRTNPGA